MQKFGPGCKTRASATFSSLESKAKMIPFAQLFSNFLSISWYISAYFTQLSGNTSWTYKLSKVYSWVPGLKYL